MRTLAWPPKHPGRKRMLLLFLPLPLLLTGCALRVGPKRLPHEEFDYSAAIATSWKEQMLTNPVKMRYADPPVFLDIAQVVSQYTLEASATVNTPDWRGNPSGPAAGVFGRWAESPTITYNLMSGDKFAKSLLEPISPASLLQLVQSGWPIDTGVWGGGKSDQRPLCHLRRRNVQTPRGSQFLQSSEAAQGTPVE
jgi:hypothetical protein